MNSEEYRRRIAVLGLTQEQAGAVFLLVPVNLVMERIDWPSQSI